MQDQEYLNHYVNATKICEGRRILKIENTNLEFIYMSRAYKKFLNVTNDGIIGRRLKDSDHPGKELAKKFKPIALKALATKSYASFFIVYKLPHFVNKECIIYTLEPIVNPTTKNIVGMTGEMHIIDPGTISRMFSFINSSSPANTEEDNLNSVKLSEREEEVLFLLTLGHSYKEISLILSNAANKQILSSTINSIIHRQLFKKFDVTSTTELVIKSAQAKALKRIPGSILELKHGIYEVTFTELDVELLTSPIA